MASDQPAAKTFGPINTLKEKVGEIKLDPNLLKRAEAAMETFQSENTDWGEDEVRKLMAAWTALSQAPTDDDKVDGVFAESHEIRGQAATFGYPLLTEIGSSLCRFIEGVPRPLDTEGLKCVQAHVEAMVMIVGSGLRGDGGAAGAKLTQELFDHAAKVKG